LFETFALGLRRWLAAVALVVVLVVSPSAFALNSVRVSVDADAIDLTHAVDRYSGQGDKIQVATAAGPDKIERRIEVSALEAGANPNWIVFALTNDSDEQLTRLIVAPHYRFVGSGVIWPDLGSARITTITASQGEPPEREDQLDTDVFRVTLDPGATVTYIAELKTSGLPQLYLWEPDAYKDNTSRLTLFQGIVIGIAGLIALFLTMVFVVRGALMFPAAALLGWAVFGYVCIDFGFWRKILNFDDDIERVWRAGVEATIGAALIVFLFAYLNLRRWHARFLHIGVLWLLTMAVVVGLSVYNPTIAAGVARISIATVAGVGLLLIFALSLRGSERALLLIPTWLLLCLWVVAAAEATLGRLTNDLVAPGLIGGLVLIVMLVGFTIMQSAFSNTSRLRASVEDVERRALAMTGSGDAIFDWNVVSDEIYIAGEVESQLGLKRGALEGPAARWLDVLHPLDRDRYVALLDGLLHQRSGRIQHDLRLKGADGHYSWFLLKARPVLSPEGEVARVIGSLADVTESKKSEERILHDAIHDNLTGLPNRELFFDRLEVALSQTRKPGGAKPVVLVVDIDHLKTINDSLGLSFGDSALLTVARRAGRDLKPGDTLARLSGDQFGLIAVLEGGGEQAGIFAEGLRAALAQPISFGDREVKITASIGYSVYDPDQHARANDVIADAELALAAAKKQGGDRVSAFNRSMRAARRTEAGALADLRSALDRGEFTMLYQPIVRLEDRTVAGFDALLRWRHPRQGVLTPADFFEEAENGGAWAQIAMFAFEATTKELAAWQRALEVHPPIFATLNISSRFLIGDELLADLRSAITQRQVMRNSLKLEFSEQTVMENPEFSAHVLPRAREIGAGLALRDFGAGHTSLAHLERFRFDTLKIAQSLARPNAAGQRPAVLRSVVTLAHDLGMDAVVEGVETESDAVALAQLGCEFAEGQAFGQPMTAVQARKLMGAAAE
jgi:diguanylate cyclase (GGDEF)-like protein/PAS domain S-box-containing protein